MKIKKIEEIKFWRELQEKGDKNLQEVLENFSKNLTENLEIKYFNIGFINEHIQKLYPELPKIFEHWGEEDKKLQNLLKELFENIEKKPDFYLYKLLQTKTYFEVTDSKRLKDFSQQIEDENIKNLYQNLWEKNPYYLTIYYKKTFLIDSLIVAKNKLQDEVINYIKASLQYLAGYLIHTISIYYALRAAVAAIMSRNMSHIHGSHIEPGIQHRMDTFKELIKKRMKKDE